MSETTPGPWHAGETGSSKEWANGVRRIRGGSMDHLICELPNWEWAEQQANARLIAAAPELLAVAREALGIAQAVGAVPLEEHVRAAIAKAEGRS